jgi:2-polyprenyl-3-methyl-5-hydroxy-6-metoxy-1,4-benzoquinol methylase
MNLINQGDFLEAFTKVRQRGLNYFLRKVNLNSRKRTQSTFNPVGADGSNWWIIPEVKQRENLKLAGDSQKTFDIYLAENYFQNRSELKLLSVACGVGNREIKLAESGHFKEVLGIDLSLESINEANRKVKEKGAMQYSV